jgi:hypothetical protein
MNANKAMFLPIFFVDEKLYSALGMEMEKRQEFF